MIGHTHRRPHLVLGVIGGIMTDTLTARLLASTPNPPGIEIVVDPYVHRKTQPHEVMRQVTLDFTNDWGCASTVGWYPVEDNSPKAIRRRFQEFTRSLHKEAGFAGIRPAGRKVFRKSGARAREQRDRKEIR